MTTTRDTAASLLIATPAPATHAMSTAIADCDRKDNAAGTAAPRARSQVAECSDAIWSTSAAQTSDLDPQALDRSAHPKDPATKINVVPRKGQ
jgi:hypothetical protein